MDGTMAAALVSAGRRVIERNLTWGTSGNISARLSDSAFLISASGVALDALGQDGLVRCDQDGDGATGAHTRQPSVETGLHRAVYQARPDIGAILHASPFYATLAASSALSIDPHVMTDTAYYVREVRRVPFYSPSSDELARAAAAHVDGCHVLLLDNHGALTLGATPMEAVTRMEALEMLCRMLVYGSLGVPLRPLRQEDVTSLLQTLATQSTV